MLGVVAVGMTFVILTGGIDLSVGNVVSLCSVVAAMLFANDQGVPLPLVLPAALALGTAIGAINGAIIVWRGVAPFIVTLAMMAIALGTALTITGAKPIGGIQGTYAWLGAGRIGGLIPVPVIIMVAMFIIGAIVLSSRVTVGDPRAGLGLELDAIAAVVVGGTSLFGGVGSIWGTFLGALIIIMINNLLNILNFPTEAQGIAKGLIILLAITLYKRRVE
jgi:ribose/xylose/arabinose/galactoside ABC-type transport system permease subunit